MSCAKSAVLDVEQRTREGKFPESIVYMGRNQKPELDSWIQPGCFVRLWGTLDRNTNPTHQLFSEKWGDATRMGHALIEFVCFDKNGQRRDFDMGFMYESPRASSTRKGLPHNFKSLQGRIISPDWVFTDKAIAQARKPQNEYIRLLALGTLTEPVYRRLKMLVESPESQVKFETTKEGRHVYDIRHPTVATYRAAVPWVGGRALGGCHNCTSFVMSMFESLLTCVSKSKLVIPGVCRPLPAGMIEKCNANGLPDGTERGQKRRSVSPAPRKKSPSPKRRRAAAHSDDSSPRRP